MKSIIRIFLVCAIICNIIISITITIGSIFSSSYFNEYENLKSFKNKKLYMIDDFLLIKRVSQDTGTGEGMRLSFIVEGTVLSDNSKIKLRATKLEYLKSNLNKQPIYKSKLTGDFFFKDAPEEYYNSQINSFYLNLYFKISFYIIIGLIIYLTINYLKNRKYRI
ncbi:hypothetical protein [Flavobacterium piscis]|uniref:DUF3592 domain-containing protein n=1 Tax=Flavobacterium piscis TaxID=1114874 RepID=A0ABU1YDD0_9FLAO|nr:hypothetical protein [Flavobacterium piscis]MDR7212237.1 hypothetical protein [Flavobacterium piscis]